MFKIIILVSSALISFAGYAFLIGLVTGIDTGDAMSVITSGKLEHEPSEEIQEGQAPSDSLDSRDEGDQSVGLEDSLIMVLSEIKTEKAELVKIRDEVARLLEAKKKADEERLYNLAKIYNGMNSNQLVNVMADMDDSLIVEILPRMKNQKASKILESMPADRAAKISTRLLGTD